MLEFRNRLFDSFFILFSRFVINYCRQVIIIGILSLIMLCKISKSVIRDLKDDADRLNQVQCKGVEHQKRKLHTSQNI